MEKFKNLLILLVFSMLPISLYGIELSLRTDTLYRVDTIITKEVITRSEVIHREEKLVKYYEEGGLIEKKINPDGSEIIISSSETITPGEFKSSGIEENLNII